MATSLFYFRDNIYNFIAGASIQIAGEENDGRNEYGFYFDKVYFAEGNPYGLMFKEDGSHSIVHKDGYVVHTYPAGNNTYSNGSISMSDSYGPHTVGSDGKTISRNGTTWYLQE